MEQFKNLIGGEMVAPQSGEFIDNFCPSTGAKDSLVPRSNGDDVRAAVAAASQAFKIWSNTPVMQRVEQMMRLADLVEQNADALAKAESHDQGKPLWLARGTDIYRASANLRFFAHAIVNNKSEAFTSNAGHVDYIRRAPLGPSALISPWNLPLYILTWKIAPCIATGNTAICKPSELTPRTAHMFSELTIEAGMPPGVINILHGYGHEVGQALVEHPEVPVISFTGGTITGGHISQSVAKMFKKTSFELGGKNPNIIFADCDFENMIKTTLRSSFINQGEVCLCGSRILVEDSLYDKFIQRFVKETDALQVGDPSDENTFMGALVSKAHLEKVLSYVDLAIEEGGEVRTQREVKGLSDKHKDGYFMRPTVITGLTPGCRVQQEEIFGPVVTVTPFKSEEEAIAMANGVQYGLSASLWTADSDRSHRVAQQIKAGTVW
jgi:aminomuconate-semialdehyde/2-hydroxymuconate-6-semialdehyde dehydrogenase